MFLKTYTCTIWNYETHKWAEFTVSAFCPKSALDKALDILHGPGYLGWELDSVSIHPPTFKYQLEPA